MPVSGKNGAVMSKRPHIIIFNPDEMRVDTMGHRATRRPGRRARMGEEPGKANGYIFANALGNPANRHSIARTFRSLCDHTGIPRRGIHALRHTFATNWVQRNPDIASLSRILDHADTAFTCKTYCHFDPASMQQGMEQMAALISQAE